MKTDENKEETKGVHKTGGRERERERRENGQNNKTGT
jgi:hypothetical protein